MLLFQLHFIFVQATAEDAVKLVMLLHFHFLFILNSSFFCKFSILCINSQFQKKVSFFLFISVVLYIMCSTYTLLINKSHRNEHSFSFQNLRKYIIFRRSIYSEFYFYILLKFFHFIRTFFFFITL